MNRLIKSSIIALGAVVLLGLSCIGAKTYGLDTRSISEINSEKMLTSMESLK